MAGVEIATSQNARRDFCRFIHLRECHALPSTSSGNLTVCLVSCWSDAGQGCILAYQEVWTRPAQVAINTLCTLFTSARSIPSLSGLTVGISVISSLNQSAHMMFTALPSWPSPQAARQLLTLDTKDPKRLFEGPALLRRMVRFGLLGEDERELDFVLQLTTEKMLERRLQTKVCARFPPCVSRMFLRIARIAVCAARPGFAFGGV